MLAFNQFHFFIVFMQGPELLSKYVGESERAVREVCVFLLKWKYPCEICIAGCKV